MKKDPILVTASYDGEISLWDTNRKDWVIKKSFPSLSEYTINRLCISNEKNYLGASCSDGMRIFDLNENLKIKSYIEEKTNVISAGFHKTGDWLYYSTEKGELNILDPKINKVNKIYSQNEDINCSVLNPNQGEIIFGDANGNIKVFDLKANKIIANLCICKRIGVRSLAFSMDASLLAVADSAGVLHTLTISKA